MEKKLKLYGFNNLTKTLSFNIYDVCYAESPKDKQDYIAYIDEQYNSERLTEILCQVAKTIDANVLNIAKQDYDPQGASVTILISEEPVCESLADHSCNLGKYILADRSTILAHLDKSHITVHTYPEYHPENSVSTARLDIDVSTCGTISPLKALNMLISSFDSDIITIDYRVRGFTRDVHGHKCFIDHPMSSIQDYIDAEILEKYNSVDVNMYQSNIFHTKMMIKKPDLDDYLFNLDASQLTADKRLEIMGELQREMIEIYNGMNLWIPTK